MPNNTKSRIGERIKYIRESKQLSVSDVSKAIGLQTTNSILSIEHGDKIPGFDRVEQICEFFEMTLVEFLQVEVPEGFAPKKEPSILGQKIAKAREDLGHSISALAEASGLSEKLIKMLETGSSKSTSSMNTLALARALGANVEYFLDDKIPVQE